MGFLNDPGFWSRSTAIVLIDLTVAFHDAWAARWLGAELVKFHRVASLLLAAAITLLGWHFSRKVTLGMEAPEST